MELLGFVRKHSDALKKEEITCHGGIMSNRLSLKVNSDKNDNDCFIDGNSEAKFCAENKVSKHKARDFKADDMNSPSPSKQPRLSQHLQRHPRKYVDIHVSSNTTDVKSIKKSPSKRLNKFSPIRYLKAKSKPALKYIPINAYFNCRRTLNFDKQILKTDVSLQLNVTPEREATEDLMDCQLGNFFNDINSIHDINDSNLFELIDVEIGHSDMYVGNFLKMLKDVLKNNHTCNLILEDEMILIKKYISMSKESKQLYIKMFGRKEGWHRVSDIKYEMDLPKLFIGLEENGFVTSDYSKENLGIVLNLLKVAELKDLCKKLRIPELSKTKPELVDALLKFGKTQSTMSAFFKTNSVDIVRKSVQQTLGHCIQLCVVPRQLFKRIILIFSATYTTEEDRKGNVQFFQLYNVEAGKMVYPRYQIIRNKPIFANRDDLLRFENAIDLDIQITEAIERKDSVTVKSLLWVAREQFKTMVLHPEARSAALKLPLFLRKFCAGTIYSRSLYKSITFLKKDCEVLEKSVDVFKEMLQQDVYGQAYRGRWYEHLALNLHHHLKRPFEAAEIILEGLKDPYLREVDNVNLCKRAQLLSQRKKGGVTKEIKEKLVKAVKLPNFELPSVTIRANTVLGNKTGFKLIFVHNDEDTQETNYSSVEEYVVQHYKRDGYIRGIHSEGSIICTIFGLLFWDIIYEHPVPDVFQTPYQAVPLDLRTLEFYENRKDAIDARLLEMNSWTHKKIIDLLELRITEHEEKVCLVDWNWCKNKLIFELIECIDVPVLVKLCERLAKSYRASRSGFPDLAVWAPGGLKYKFVEVKGPNDHLATNQILWMNYLVSCGANAEVCYVETAGYKFPKKRSSKKTEEK